MTEIHTRRIDEHVVEGRRLGRHVAHDPRSRNYAAETAAKLHTIRHQAEGLPLDQGQVGSCTAEALCGALNCAPDRGAQLFIQSDAYNLYHDETVLEGTPWPPEDPGGSGLYVCRAAKHRGWVRLYRHAFGIDHALRALVLRPAIFGFDWYEGFDEPDADGLVKIAGGIRGGHEVVADELDVERKLVGFWNSWGDWGLGGRFYMSFDTVDQLLQAEGDCTVPYV